MADFSFIVFFIQMYLSGPHFIPSYSTPDGRLEAESFQGWYVLLVWTKPEELHVG